VLVFAMRRFGRLGLVAEPVRPRLGHEPDVLRAVAREGGQRQRDDRGGHGDRRGDRRAGEVRAPDVLEPPRRPAHDQREHREPERGLPDVDPQLALAEALRLLDLGRAEVVSRLHRDRIGKPTRSHHHHGGLGHDHRGDERDRQAP